MIFDELAHQLQERQPLPPLCPTNTHDSATSLRIENASDDELFDSVASTPEPKAMRAACRAGLFLLNDDLENSHRISQTIETPTGSFWHAIMHRREGDFSNANYWWQRVGEHPAFADVYTQALSTLQSDDGDNSVRFLKELQRAGCWKPTHFVAQCETATVSGASTHALQKIQLAEITSLLNWCRARI